MLAVLEVVFLFFAVLFVGTQILWPTLKGTLMFPLFHKTAALEHDLAEAKQEQADLHLAAEVQKVRDEVAVEKAKAAKVAKAIKKSN